ncbi:unnamed protein product [Dicrocoelium dendriticum]|nr:unnamed protein product [Dicrocoelium dendriticum]
MPKVLRGKCVVLGASTVGKSAIVQSFASDGADFPRNYCMSVSAELVVKNVIIPEVNDTVELFIYTLPGKDVFSTLADAYVDHINMLIVVFDLTDTSSFKNAKSILAKWLTPSRVNLPPTVLIGNKSDLQLRRRISTEEATELAKSFNITYYETSAKEAIAIDKPFVHVAKEYHSLYAKKIETLQNLI